MTINGITIGDKFKKGNIECEVVDFYMVTSLKDNSFIKYNCIACSKLSGEFEVPFATVIRFKLNNK